MIIVRAAAGKDREAVRRLLARNDLPLPGVDENFHNYIVAVDGEVVVGAIGLELYGTTGLLRSAVVERSRQGSGIGGQLVDALFRSARKAGIMKLVLLTNTAEQYFAGKGFRSVDRTSVSGPVTQSVEFTDACPSHAVCMEIDL